VKLAKFLLFCFSALKRTEVRAPVATRPSRPSLFLINTGLQPGAKSSARGNCFNSFSVFSFRRRQFSGILPRMGKRREARERAVQFLFQSDLNPPENLDDALTRFWETQRAAAIADEKDVAHWGQPTNLPPPTAEEAEMRLFAEPLIRGTIQHRDEADALIKKHAQNWDFHRIAAVDRNIMRLAIYEMLHREDIPPVVSINEAVDIAKKFSTQDSGKFVNGILDKIKGELMRPARIVK
jgi:N utilization substance protein B